MKSLYKKSLLGMPLYACLLLTINVLGQSFPGAPEPWRTEYNIDVSGVQFSHPMTVLNQADLNTLKDRIANNAEPQISAYNDLLAEATLQLQFTSIAPSNLWIPGGHQDGAGLQAARDVLWEHSYAAYTLALTYALTDNTTYAEKAEEILMDWTNTATTFSGDDRGLQLGSYFSGMLYAADLIYNYSGWTSTDREAFKAWWGNEVLTGSGAVREVSRVKDNNWKDAGLLGLIAAAIVLEDPNHLQEALVQLKSYFYSRTDGSVRNPGSEWKISKDNQGVYLEREVVRSGGRKGITYTQYAMTTMVQAFDIARYAGFDYTSLQTEEGATLQDVVEWMWRWDEGGISFPWNSNPDYLATRKNAYEWANSRYDVIPELRTWVQNNRPLNGAQGNTWITLTQGDMSGGSGPTPTIPSAPSGLSAMAASSTTINLTWTDNANNEDGFRIERQSGGSFTEIATVGANVTNYSNTGLTASTTYTYRVRAYNTDGNSGFSNESSATTQGGGGTSGAFQESGGVLSIEAEHGTIGSNWIIATDNSASEGEYIEIDPQFNTTQNTPVCTTAECLASYNFDISTGGDYAFWFRIYSAGGNDDSFFWRIDNGTWVRENSRNGVGIWYSTNNTMVNSLNSGSHTLEISYRENGTRLDKFVIQLDSQPNPTGNGPAESSRGGAGARTASSEVHKPRSQEVPMIASSIYPNPFISYAKIKYSLLEDSQVTLLIINAMGQKVRELVSEYQLAGEYEITWEATDSRGSSTSPGIYFSRIQIGDKVFMDRMLLMK
ncbi:alginate lyase family protein [Fulvivirga sp. M361]|uniref:alginate lyase family protein n=1 Tax=Fulvivirga sp. M361 TaxID=2594266 RepID=UPI00162AB87B|nr:alginate lyase family protein [Fulvivirga sp. M361]